MQPSRQWPDDGGELDPVGSAEVHRDEAIILGLHQVDRQDLHLDAEVLDGSASGLQDLVPVVSVLGRRGDGLVIGDTCADRQGPIRNNLFRPPHTPTHQRAVRGGVEQP